MPELRWTLLLLGILFLAGLGWWELRKGRRGREAQAGRTTSLPERPEPPLEEVRAMPREPTLTLPEIRPREPARRLPVVEIEALEPEMDEPGPPPEPELAAAAAHLPPEADEVPGAPVVLPEARPPAEVIVDWPPEAERRLIGVRLVAAPGARYSGRLLRQALAAAGLLHGRFGIFHYPAPDGRAAFSAASLTKPGNFDLESMDAQRYAGVSLFAVLPGPLEPAETIERLVETAHELAGRLGGALQDDHGEPLEADRIAELCAMAAGAPGTAAADPEGRDS